MKGSPVAVVPAAVQFVAVAQDTESYWTLFDEMPLGTGICCAPENPGSAPAEPTATMTLVPTTAIAATDFTRTPGVRFTEMNRIPRNKRKACSCQVFHHDALEAVALGWSKRGFWRETRLPNVRRRRQLWTKVNPSHIWALEVGTPVLTASGAAIGTVEHVLQVPELDLFDGIAVKTKHGLRFVDRDQISDITTTRVGCLLTDEQAAALPAPHGTLVLHPDTAHDEGPSLTARFGRLFGREHWKELE
jgi:hypothetical protein